MNLYTEVISERGKAVQKTGNEYLIIDLNVHRDSIGQVELYYSDDTKHGVPNDEWILQYRPDEDSDWEIIAQGNVPRKCVECKLAASKGHYCTIHAKEIPL